MKLLLTNCLGMALVAIANPVAADAFERGFGFRPGVQDQRVPAEPQRTADKPAPPREMPPQRGMRVPGEADRGRMSPDERRQLRRDIQDAGKDIYRRDRPAPRREQRR